MLSPFCRSRANVYTRTSPRNVREPFCKLGGAVQGQFLCSRICNPLKKYLLVRSHEILPENVGSWSSRLRMSRSLVQMSFDPTGPLEKREAAPDRSWRKLRLILRRGRQSSNIFGAKAHANVLKGTFSTDCKSNCIRIGLLRYTNSKQPLTYE